MRKRPLLLGACVFVAGTAFGRTEVIWLPVVLTVWLFYEFYCGQKYKTGKRWIGRNVLLLFIFFLGWYHMEEEEAFRQRYLSHIEDGEMATVRGEIKEIEETDYGSFRMYLRNCIIYQKGAEVPCNDVMVYASSCQCIPGEKYQITGQVQMFESARNDGGFDAVSFYQSQKIDFILKMKEVKPWGRNPFNLLPGLNQLKDRLFWVYRNSLSEEAAGFLIGMVLGDKSLLDEELKELFTDGGIGHILAISGLHVSILGKGLYDFFRKRQMGFGVAGILAGTVLVAYCLMVGSGMSTRRAVGMMLLCFLAGKAGRSYDMLNGLGAMVLYLLWDNPFLIEYSGFWFSVTALWGVGVIGPALQVPDKPPLHNPVSRFFGGMNGIYTGIGITLSTLPIVAFCYYEIPLYSAVVNYLLLPLMTPMFTLAVVGGGVGMFLPVFGKWLLLPCQWGLWLYRETCTVIEKLPFSNIICGRPAMVTVAGFYLLLLIGVWVIKESKPAPGRRGWMVGGMYLTLLVLLIYPKTGAEEITFLDVGQGDGIYINTGDGTGYFIDGGSTDEKNLGEYCLLPFLKCNGIRKIDYWFVTHADTDHMSGVLEVLESGYQISCLVLSGAAPEDENLSKLLYLAKEQQVPVLYMQKGDEIRTKNTCLSCLYPSVHLAETYPKLAADRNDTSLVLSYVSREFMGVKEFAAVFTGDISAEAERVIIQEGEAGQVDLYKVSHHGSRFSSCEEYVDALRPAVSVISCSSTNRYGHPSEEVVLRLSEAGSKIYYTMDCGQVRFRER